MLSSILLSLIAVLLIVLWYYKFYTDAQRAKVIDVTTGKSVPGQNVYQTIYSRVLPWFFRVDRGKSTLSLPKKYGKVYTNYTPGMGVSVVFTEPKDVKMILKQIDDFPKLGFRNNGNTEIIKLIGKQAITSVNNPEWHGHRVILNKAFISNAMFVEPMKKKVDILTSHWNNETVTVGDDIQKLTLDVLASCIFGMEFDSLNGGLSEPLRAYNYSIREATNPIRFLFPTVAKLLPNNYKLRKELTIFDDYCWSIINKVKRERDEEKSAVETNHNEKNLPSLIQLMMENGLPSEVIRDNVSLFFLAGHETTSTSLCWALILIANHPDVQEKARREVFEKIPDDYTYEDIKKLTYLDWIIHETMRLYPALPINGSRHSESDATIGNIRVPAKTVITFDLITMAHNKDIWGDPEVFRPERWSNENITKEQRGAWMPFSMGPRVCIGMGFSLVEQKIFLVSVLKKFSEIKLAPNAIIEPSKSFLYAPNADKLIFQFTPIQSQ